MTIIEANSELHDCIAIRMAVFVEEQKVPVELEVDEKDVADGSCRHFLVLEDGKPVGTFRGFFESADTVHLQRICLLPSARGKGYGRAMLDYAEAYFGARGAKKLVLGAQCHAVGFYEACGFEVSSDCYSDAGILHRDMVKVLN